MSHPHPYGQAPTTFTGPTTADPFGQAHQPAGPNDAVPGWARRPPEDPLIPADLGGWLRRIFAVMGRSGGRLALLSAAPAALIGLYTAGLNHVMNDNAYQAAVTAQVSAAARSGGGPVSIALTMFDAVYGQLLPYMVILSLTVLVVVAFVQSASIFIAVRDATGHRTGVTEGLRFACTRALPLAGWLLVAQVLVTVACVFLLLPGMYLSVVLFASLTGVVVIERSGIGRCFALIKGRFWATVGRLCVAGLLCGVYAVVLGIVAGLFFLLSPVLGGLAYGVLMIPGMTFFTAAYLLTYTELRHHENPTTTATLAAELTRP